MKITTTDRVRGVIYYRPEKRRFFFIRGRDGSKIFCPDQQCIAPKGHYCLFSARADVEFLLDEGRAYECRLVDEPTIGREVSTVVDWRGEWGVAKRSCGCDVIIRLQDILSTDEALLTFGTGSQIEHDTENIVVKNKLKVRAFNIDILKP